MRFINKDAELVPIDELIPFLKNPRQGDVGAISESIKKNGFYGSLVAQVSSKRILAGNHRWMAAKALDFTEIPVVWVDVDDETALRIMLADNRTSDLASNDFSVLADLLTNLSQSNQKFAGTGYTGDDLDFFLEELSTERTIFDSRESDSTNGSKQSITLFFDSEKYETVLSMIESLRWNIGLESYGDCFEYLLTNWQKTSSG